MHHIEKRLDMPETIPAQFRDKRTIKWGNDPIKKWRADDGK